jgi:ParB-like chromosome segregation protein Spo0J
VRPIEACTTCQHRKVDHDPGDHAHRHCDRCDCRTFTPTFEIVAGERRCRAMALLGWAEYPVIVRHLTDDQASDVMLLENLARVDLDPVAEGLAFRSRLDRGLAVRDVAERAGVSVRRVQSRLRLLDLAPDVQHLVAHGQVTLGQADALVGLDVNRQRLALEGLHAGLDDRGYRALIARLRAEQDAELLFDPSTFFQVEEYVIGAQEQVQVEQLSMFAQQIQSATKARDDAICQLHKAGRSLRDIAGLVGLSHAGVRHIIGRTA